MKGKNDLEERLIDFAITVSEIIESLNESRLSTYISNQLIRSGTSPALHYGEAEDAESRADFIHKIKVILKELRETFIALKIISKKNLSKNSNIVKVGLKENNELISIFVSSLKTARGKGKGIIE